MKVAVLGAGKVGTAVARAALRAGHTVKIAGSGPASGIDLIVRVVVPGATAADAASAVDDADVVVLSLPVTKHRTLDPDLLAGRIVIDAMNYWPATDGYDPDFADSPRTSSEVVASHLPRSRIVKTLNHIGYHELERDGSPSGTRSRRALAVVSDDEDAVHVVAALIDSLGFDPVPVFGLALGRWLEPGTAVFAEAMTADRVAETLTAAAGSSAPAAVPAVAA